MVRVYDSLTRVYKRKKLTGKPPPPEVPSRIRRKQEKHELSEIDLLNYARRKRREKHKNLKDDLFYSRIRDTKYFKITKTYLIVKTMVCQALHKTRSEESNILHTIHNLDGKFELFYNPSLKSYSGCHQLLKNLVRRQKIRDLQACLALPRCPITPSPARCNQRHMHHDTGIVVLCFLNIFFTYRQAKYSHVSRVGSVDKSSTSLVVFS
jgi:hypothetical protein